MPDVFISYSSTNRSWAGKLANALEKYNLDVWWDPEIKPGQAYREVIQNALDSANCVIVVWSEESVKSIWVQAEATQAVHRNVLIPVLHENTRIPMPFNSLQTANMVGWDGSVSDKKFMSLISGIELHCNNIFTNEEVKSKEAELFAKKQKEEQERKEAELLVKKQKEECKRKEKQVQAEARKGQEDQTRLSENSTTSKVRRSKMNDSDAVLSYAPKTIVSQSKRPRFKVMITVAFIIGIIGFFTMYQKIREAERLRLSHQPEQKEVNVVLETTAQEKPNSENFIYCKTSTRGILTTSPANCIRIGGKTKRKAKEQESHMKGKSISENFIYCETPTRGIIPASPANCIRMGGAIR